MSHENARRFVAAVTQDPALQQRLGASREPAELARLAVQAGSERGLSFTTEEFLASVGKGPGASSGELTDDQLESVAGGLGLSPSQVAGFWRSLGGGLGGGLKSTESTLTPSQKKI